MLHVEIQVKGCIAEHWSEWFMDLALQPTEQGQTILRGDIIDQAELYGLLARLRDLGLPLISVKCAEVEASEA